MISIWQCIHDFKITIIVITTIIIIMIRRLFVGASQCLASSTHHILIRIRIMMIALIMSTGQTNPLVSLTQPRLIGMIIIVIMTNVHVSLTHPG